MRALWFRFFIAAGMFSPWISKGKEADGDLAGIDRNMAVRAAGEKVRWIGADTAPMRLSGMAFRRPGEGFFRVPQKDLPPAVVRLGRCTSGVQLAFKSDTSQVSVRVKLFDAMIMDHMADTGSCGFDLYCGAPREKRFLGCARFALAGKRNAAYTAEIAGKMEKKMREFTLDFPLYAGIETFELGIDPDAKLEAPSPWKDERPVVWYGTSITQGGCASRPGMATTNILSRKWNRPILNFGFSGSGKGESSVAGLLAEIEDPAMYVLDYEANAHSKGLRETLDGFIGRLRARHPDVPVVVLSASPSAPDPGRDADRAEGRVFQRQCVERRRAAGDGKLFFIDGAPEIPGAGEWTVDGIHLSDNGFARQAEYLAPLLEAILAGEK